MDFDTLSDEEKASSIRSKIKNIQFQRYNVELDVLMETAVSNPNDVYIAELQAQIADMQLKQDALEAELATLS